MINKTFLNRTHASNTTEKATLFSNHFGSFYKALTRGSSPTFNSRLPSPVGHHTISQINVNSDTIKRLDTSLKDNVHRGPDEVPCVKQCWRSLFNKSLSTGVIPDSWKISYIQPIFKNGDERGIKNYRPISILSTILKLWDAIIANELSNSFISSVIAKEQHGFMKNRSIRTNLLI